MRNFFKVAITLWAITLVTSIARAADIELLDIPGQSVKFVSIKGEILSGDGARFVDVVEGHDRVSVILESRGGVVKEALQIGAEIRLRNFATMVLPDDECFSACGLIWVSGARRYMSPTSKLGFHAAYREENGEYKESGVANAEIGSFLTHLGLRIEAIRFFTIAGPTEYLRLTPERARALGIEVFEQNGTEVTTPSEAPTADIHADRFVSYTLLLSKCGDLLEPDKAVIDRAVKRAFDEGNRIVGGDKWIDLWTPLLDEVKAQINSKGILALCLEVEAQLRGQGQPTGVDGPSFACSAASTSTEQSMCADEALWAKDRAMNAIYFYIRGYDNAKVRKALLADQRQWLKQRNACGGNTSCLNSVYDERLQLFREVDVSQPVN